MNTLNFLPYTCKADSWDEVEIIRPTGDVKNLELIQADILGKTPCSEFTAEAPGQFFLARNAKGLFLINTEGYKYARYALRIVEVL